MTEQSYQSIEKEEPNHHRALHHSNIKLQPWDGEPVGYNNNANIDNEELKEKENNDETDNAATQMSIFAIMRMLLPQAMIGFIDAVSFLIVAPSLIFYVMRAGGSQSMYGIILSAFSLASLLAKPVIGNWADCRGFRQPYLVSITIASLGSLIYFIAGSYEGTTSLTLILLGRILSGLGAGNDTLGFSYVAHVVPHDRMTQASAMLTMSRVVGMAVGPGISILMDRIHTSVTLFGGIISFELDNLNSVGLSMLLANALGFLIIYFLLEEPTPTKQHNKEEDQSTTPGVDLGNNDCDKDYMVDRWTFWRNVFSIDILIPLLATFTVQMNYQLISTSLAPAAYAIFDWGPSTISMLYGFNSVTLLLIVALVFVLTSFGVHDSSLMRGGLMLSIVSYMLLYFCWEKNASLWMFVVPYALASAAFPFLGAPTRSVFTRAAGRNEHLRDYQGTMQAINSMVVTVPGFIGPGLIAHYILRTPGAIAESADHRVFTGAALFAPILAACSLVGFVYVQRRYYSDSSAHKGEANSCTDYFPSENSSLDEFVIDEQLALLAGRNSIQRAKADVSSEMQSRFNSVTEAYRQTTCILMNIPPASSNCYYDDHDIPRPKRISLIRLTV